MNLDPEVDAKFNYKTYIFKNVYSFFVLHVSGFSKFLQIVQKLILWRFIGKLCIFGMT